MYEDLIKEYYIIIKNKIAYQQFESAMRNADKLIYNFPKLSMGYYFKGVCFFAMQNYEESIKWYTIAIKLNQRLAKAYFNLGVSCYMLNMYDSALLNIGKALIIFVRQKERDSASRCKEALKFIYAERKTF